MRKQGLVNMQGKIIIIFSSLYQTFCYSFKVSKYIARSCRYHFHFLVFLLNIVQSHPITSYTPILSSFLLLSHISSFHCLLQQPLSPRSISYFFLSIFLLSILICNFPLVRDSGCKMEGFESYNLWRTLTLARTKDARTIFHLLLLLFSIQFYAPFCLRCFSPQNHRKTITHYMKSVSTFWHAHLVRGVHEVCVFTRLWTCKYFIWEYGLQFTSENEDVFSKYVFIHLALFHIAV